MELKVIPRASKDEIVDLVEDRLKIKIKAPPVEGKANREIIKFFSSILRIPKKEIEIIKGTSSSHKSILFYEKGEEIVKKILSHLKKGGK